MVDHKRYREMINDGAAWLRSARLMFAVLQTFNRIGMTGALVNSLF